MFLVLTISRVAQSDDPSSKSSEDAVRVLLAGYSENRDSFPVIDCRFEYVSGGSAASIDNALQRQVEGKIKPRDGHWLVSGHNVLYSLLCKPETSAENAERIADFVRPSKTKDKDAELSLDCDDRLYLRSEGYSLRYGPLIQAANIFTTFDTDGEGIRITPFNIDVHGSDEYANPGRNLRDALSGNLDYRYIGVESFNGISGVFVELGNNLTRKKIGFDPAKGYLPVYGSQTNGKTGQVEFEIFVIKSQECSGGRWFPMEIVKIERPKGEPPFRTEWITVTSLDVDHEPPESNFQIELQNGTQVNVPGRFEWTTLKADETFKSSDLASLNQRCIDHGIFLKKRKADALASLNLKSGYIQWKYLIIANILVLSIVLVFFFRHRRLKRSTK